MIQFSNIFSGKKINNQILIIQCNNYLHIIWLKTMEKIISSGFFLLVIKNISLLREVLISMCSNMLEFLDIFLYSMDYK